MASRENHGKRPDREETPTFDPDSLINDLEPHERQFVEQFRKNYKLQRDADGLPFMHQRLGFFQTWGLVLFQPDRFFQCDRSTKARVGADSLHLLLCFLMLCLAHGVIRSHSHLLRLDANGLLEKFQAKNNWKDFWGSVAWNGLLRGSFHLFIMSWWFNDRVGLSDGNRDRDTAYSLSLDSAVLSSLCLTSFGLYAFATQPTPVPLTAPPIMSLTGSCLLLILSLLSLRISYSGVTEVMGADPDLARNWFVIAPAILYGLLFLPHIFSLVLSLI